MAPNFTGERPCAAEYLATAQNSIPKEIKKKTDLRIAKKKRNSKPSVSRSWRRLCRSLSRRLLTVSVAAAWRSLSSETDIIEFRTWLSPSADQRELERERERVERSRREGEGSWLIGTLERVDFRGITWERRRRRRRREMKQSRHASLFVVVGVCLLMALT